MAKNLVNGTNIVIEENADNINMNLSSTYTSSLTQQINNSFKNNNVYSASETVVGIWIDNKPIYRKVIQIPSFSTTTITVNTGLTNISNVIDFKGSFKRTDFGTPYFYSIDNIYIDEWTLNYNTGVLSIATNNQYVTYSGYITIEYTKTTD